MSKSMLNIDDFFIKKISSLEKCSDSFLDLYIKSSEEMSGVGIQNEEDFFIAKNAFQFLNDINIKNKKEYISELVKGSRSANIKNSNDCYYFIFNSIMSDNLMKKKAYPLMFSIPGDGVLEQYDIEKWGSLVHKIYDAVNSSDMSYLNAVDYYSGFLEENEAFSFKRWINYYKDGEHLKYSSEEVTMKKKSSVPFELINGPYHDEPTFDYGKVVEEMGASSRLKESYKKWKAKFNAALRRIDRLLRSSEEFVSPEVFESLADDLHTLSKDVNKVRMPVTASDLAFKTANKFQKKGFNQGASILRKFAQDIPQADGLAAPEPPPAPEQPAQEGAASAAPEQPQEVEEPDPEPIDIKDIEPIPGPSEGEYAQLAQDINLSDASSKLEEVAGMLADRRVIRLLAEFDIMLDKLGIASMFPELAESQAKLIDGYGYALTRVSKMLGMIANSNKLVEMSKDNAGEEGAGTEEVAGVPQEPAMPTEQELV